MSVLAPKVHSGSRRLSLPTATRSTAPPSAGLSQRLKVVKAPSGIHVAKGRVLKGKARVGLSKKGAPSKSLLSHK